MCKKGGSELLLNEPPVFAPLGGGGANASTWWFGRNDKICRLILNASLVADFHEPFNDRAGKLFVLAPKLLNMRGWPSRTRSVVLYGSECGILAAEFFEDRKHASGI